MSGRRDTPEEVFVDGIRTIGIAGGAVRVEFHTLTAEAGVETSAQKLEREPRIRLVLTLEGFLGVATAMGEMLTQLEQKGLIRRQPKPGAAGPAAPAGRPPSPTSPNF